MHKLAYSFLAVVRKKYLELAQAPLQKFNWISYMVVQWSGLVHWAMEGDQTLHRNGHESHMNWLLQSQRYFSHSDNLK